MEILKEIKINGDCWLQLYQNDTKTNIYHIRLFNKTNDHNIKMYSTAKWDEAKAEFDYLLEMLDVH
jgi:hypothetical protein